STSIRYRSWRSAMISGSMRQPSRARGLPARAEFVSLRALSGKGGDLLAECARVRAHEALRVNLDICGVGRGGPLEYRVKVRPRPGRLSGRRIVDRGPHLSAMVDGSALVGRASHIR